MREYRCPVCSKLLFIIKKTGNKVFDATVLKPIDRLVLIIRCNKCKKDIEVTREALLIN